jgi:hypothetical protein
MTRRTLHTLAAVVAMLAVSAIAASAASAQSYADRTQTQHNYAGVVFNPSNDCFTIYDNVENSKRVRVSWNYVGISDRVKKLYSSGWRTFRCPRISERYSIKFRVSGHDKSGFILYPSPIVWYTTVG